MIPTSDDENSSDDDNPHAGGINVASLQLSEGAFMYLQSMKTFSIMFAVLSIINLPILMIYQGTTKNNSTNINELFKYFTIGNLG